MYCVFYCLPHASDNLCRDLHNWIYRFFQRRQNVFVVKLTDNFQYQSHVIVLRTDLLFLENGKMSNLPIKHAIEQNCQYSKYLRLICSPCGGCQWWNRKWLVRIKSHRVLIYSSSDGQIFITDFKMCLSSH
jgi:hypothetical protein